MGISEEVQRELDHMTDDWRSSHDSLDRRLKSVEDGVVALKSDMGSRVPWAWFLTTVIAIGGLQATLWFYLINQIKEIREDGQATKETVAQIDGKLEPFDFIIDK